MITASTKPTTYMKYPIQLRFFHFSQNLSARKEWYVAMFSKRNIKYVEFYRVINTRESLEELGKVVERLACGLCSHSISRSPKLPLMSLQLDRNTVHVFCFLSRRLHAGSLSRIEPPLSAKRMSLQSTLNSWKNPADIELSICNESF